MSSRTAYFIRVLPLVSLSAALAAGCSSNSDPVDGATGNPSGTGGAFGSGGTTAAEGGGAALGGASAGGGAALGGSPGVGGASAFGGGMPLGGSTASGGATAVGGTTSGGGSTAAGGVTASGGSVAAGGSMAAGGSANTGGSTAAGGSATGGGSSAAGGSTATGGASGGSGDFGDRTSAELIDALTLGWNLGNSLDAPEGETAWGNPEVSPALVQAVAESGFDLVRIPVTWSLHMGPGPDYPVEPAFLSRVEEVVRYVTDRGLTAIINLHHDGADDLEGVEWITLNDPSGATTEANNAAVRERFVAVWAQVAAHFGGFGEQLLFESMNEIHDGYDRPDPAYYGIINDLNQAFVDTVRASGGNNAFRHLVVPGYNTNIEYTLEGFELPQDPTLDRLVVSVHYYDPWDFAGAGNTHTWGTDSPGRDTWGQEDHVLTQFDQLKARFVDNGVPVVIGEYGAVNQSGYEEYRRYYMEYVTKAAVDRGILPIYWDNGSKESGGEAFGLFDRSSNTVLHPTILEAMMRAATHSYSLADIAKPNP